MEFIDLKAQQVRIKNSIDTRIATVLEHGQYIMGPEVSELETKLAAFIGAKHCIGCASGTNALELVLAAWNIGEGDAVFTTPFSFISTAEAIAKTGAIPIFIDICPDTYNLDVTRLNAAIGAVQTQDRSLHPLPQTAMERALRPRAVVVVDLFGNPADYDALLPLAKKHNLRVLEDGAQGFGGRYKNSNLCNCGCHAATTSFFPAKPLGCYGDGGGVFTNDAELAALVDSLRYHGRVDAQNKNDNIRLGYNGRLDTLQAAILLAKLEIFADELRLREEVANRYTALLQKASPNIVTPQITTGGLSTWAQYTVRLPEQADRSAVMCSLKQKAIPTTINYPKGMHSQGCLASLGYAPDDFPHTQAACASVLSLPMHPYLTENDQHLVVNALITACGGSL